MSQSLPDRIYLSPPHMSADDLHLLSEAFQSNWIAPLGPHVNGFEEEFAEQMGGGYAVAVSSGTAALHLALLAVGVQPGDTVLVSTLTFVATANAIRYCGASPVFIDSEEASWNLDPQIVADELEQAAQQGKLPAAVIAVDLLGQCANYQALRDACERYEVPLVEDAAESLGSTYEQKPAGTLGDIGCFSFNGNKIITTSGGGMLVTRNREWADLTRHLASQARLPVAHYEHDQVGYNYRLSNLLAAIGRGQLSTLEERVQKRRENFEFYKANLEGLPGVSFAPEPEGTSTNRWLTCLLIDAAELSCSVDQIRLALEDKNIEARPLWKPMHMQAPYVDCRVCGGEIAEGLFRRGLCLPSGSSLTTEQRERVVEVIHKVVGRTEYQRVA